MQNIVSHEPWGYRLTPEVDNDLVEIWLYTLETWGIEQANRYLDNLEKQFVNLAGQPGLGIAVNEIRKGYCCFHHQKHLIFYRPQKKHPLEIVRVLHERMAVDRYF